MNGNVAARLTPRELIEAGVARVSEDRHALGVVGEMTIWENAILERVRTPQFSKLGFVNRIAAVNFSKKLIERFDVRGASPSTQARLLSGGNMQKLILGRCLMYAPQILIANQPTRGLDEGAISAVHAEILAVRKSGAGVLLISEDLEEVLEIADRVQAIVKGRLSPSIAIEGADARRLGLMMAGVWEGAESAA
jgi:general nucleoside transport system ATP-binding protein